MSSLCLAVISACLAVISACVLARLERAAQLEQRDLARSVEVEPVEGRLRLDQLGHARRELRRRARLISACLVVIGACLVVIRACLVVIRARASSLAKVRPGDLGPRFAGELIGRATLTLFSLPVV